MMIINGIASTIHTTVFSSYHKLNIIYIAYEKYYDTQTRSQLIDLIQSISSARKPISFYCYDIFPFKKTSVFEVMIP